MFFIVVEHLGRRSGIDNSFVIIAPHAVNCFVLISGYFLINSKFKSERFLRTATETIFYTITITVTLYLFGKANLPDVAKSIMPFAPTQFSYWFVNKYLATILLSPFICKVCSKLTKRQFQILLASLLLISSTLMKVFPFGELYGNGFSLLWMITVFITGGYLRLYAPEFKYWGSSTILLLLTYNLCSYYLAQIIQLQYNSLITFALAITTFMWFKSLSIANNGIVAKVTTFIAPHVFAVYLIHEQGLMRHIIIDILHKFNGYMPQMLYLYLFCIMVIVISAIIDKGREWCFKHTCIDSLTNKIAKKLNRLYEE